MRPLALAALLAVAVACATSAAPRLAPAPPTSLATSPSPDDLAARVAAADAKLAKYRTRSFWPSPMDHDTWFRNLADAEEKRADLARVWPGEDAAEAARRLEVYEGRLSLLTAADGTFRLGDLMRNSR